MIVNEQQAVVLSVAMLLGIATELPENCKLKRVAKNGVIKHKMPDRKIEPRSLNDCLNFDENNRVIQHFIEVLERHFSHCDLSSFYANIKTLKIVERGKNLLDKIDEIIGTEKEGDYSPSSNRIRVFEDEYSSESSKDDTKTHELLHMASSRKGFFSSFCGFYKRIVDINIGDGLNEGYTELLNRQYFAHYPQDGSYQELQMIAFGLEYIVGYKKMQQMYFSNDLEGLVQELEQYASRDEILRILIKTDKVNKLGGRGKYDEEEKLAREVRTNISNIALKKLKKDKEEGKLTEEQFIHALYSRELYINGYTAYQKHDRESKEILEYAIVEGPHFGHNKKLTPEKYKELAHKYYESKKGNYQFTSDWQDEDGNTVIDDINMSAHNIVVAPLAPREVKEEPSNKLSNTQQETELNEMFNDAQPIASQAAAAKEK